MSDNVKATIGALFLVIIIAVFAFAIKDDLGGAFDHATKMYASTREVEK